MGGRIGVESPGEGLGTTFWFTIPFKEAQDIQPETAKKDQPVKAKVVKKKFTLLIAEDNESNYLLFDTILSCDYTLSMHGTALKRSRYSNNTSPIWL